MTATRVLFISRTRRSRQSRQRLPKRADDTVIQSGEDPVRPSAWHRGCRHPAALFAIAQPTTHVHPVHGACQRVVAFIRTLLRRLLGRVDKRRCAQAATVHVHWVRHGAVWRERGRERGGRSSAYVASTSAWGKFEVHRGRDGGPRSLGGRAPACVSAVLRRRVMRVATAESNTGSSKTLAKGSRGMGAQRPSIRRQ